MVEAAAAAAGARDGANERYAHSFTGTHTHIRMI